MEAYITMKKMIVASTLAGSLLFTGNALAADYTVKPGDSLWRISKKHNVSISDLKAWNQLKSDIIFVGQNIKINKTSGVQTNSGSSTTVSSPSTYRVKAGDTFSTIAKKYNMSITALKALNPSIKNINKIFIGQIINVTNSSQSTPDNILVGSTSNSSTSSSYTVKVGDTLSAIAVKHNMTLTKLLQLNPTIVNANILKIGQVLKVGGTVSDNSTTINNSSTSSTNSSWIKKADSLITTAKKYIGASYTYGAPTSSTTTFDCSSFILRVFKENGIIMPRTSGEQSLIGKSISLSSARKGDLIFFDTNKDGKINHVSIVIDSNSIIHAASSHGVMISSFNSYWSSKVVKVMRVM